MSGGAAYGYAHIGVLKYLEEWNIRPEAVVGTSMGAIVGGLYAYGYRAEQIQEIAEQVKAIELVRLFFPSFPRGGIIDTDSIRDFFQGFVEDVRIEELPIEYRSVAVDIESGQEVVFDKGRLIDAMIASMSIPAVFKPYKYYDRYLVDGGVLNNLPWDVGAELGTTNIVVNVAPQQNPPDPPKINASEIIKEGRLQKKEDKKEKQKEKELESGEGKKLLDWKMETEDFRRQLRNLIHGIQKRDERFSVNGFLKSIAQERSEKDEPLSLPEIVTKVMAIVDANTSLPPKKENTAAAYLHPDLLEFSLNDFQKADDIVNKGYESALSDMKFVKAIRKIANKMKK